MPRKLWTHEELIVAFNLYCKIPFGKIHPRNPSIVSLANILGRSVNAVSWKLANFARLDPMLGQRNITGATHGGKRDIEIWTEFNSDWDRLAFESEKILARMKAQSLEASAQVDLNELPKEGKEREALIRLRVNQNFFRSSVLAAYNNKCCITGLAIPELLNASHIAPWATDIENRVNPRNGLCLNVMHDRAFDRGLITVTPDYYVRVSPRLKQGSDSALQKFLLDYESATIRLPDRFMPGSAFLTYHNTSIFKA
jgi:putative restriction endonuclease